jgi:hypothetical protein
MGYTTRFSGRFTFDKPADAETTLFMREVFDDRGTGRTKGAPDSYCQWEISNDRLHIEWDGEEKFYDYVEWLQWLIDNKFKPAGLTLTGSVQYDGEELEDVGTLSIEDGKVIQRPATFE